MEKYMFLFRGGDLSNLSSEEQQQRMQKWFAWVEKLTKENRYVGGEALLNEGKTIRTVKQVVTDGPFAEGKELAGGYFVINAKNLDEAVELAKDFPDFDIDGSVEVREVMKFDM
jgi:hypothetical protein